MSAKYGFPLHWAFQYADPTRTGTAGEQVDVWDEKGLHSSWESFADNRALRGIDLPHFRRGVRPDLKLDCMADWFEWAEWDDHGATPEQVLEAILSLPDEWDDKHEAWFVNAPPVDYSSSTPSAPNMDPPPFTASQRWREGAKEVGEALVRIGANPSHHLVALYMLAHAHKDTGAMFPSYSTLAALTGLSQRSTVADAVRWLVAHKVLKRTREARRDGTPARYVFNPVERWKP